MENKDSAVGVPSPVTKSICGLACCPRARARALLEAVEADEGRRGRSKGGLLGCFSTFHMASEVTG